ncbi:MAG: SPOR domain-containing protein, partial [Ignavibacteriae bacterium]|nr:SPOR domain-containing protein [Ignavibacteriota bacterium]
SQSSLVRNRLQSVALGKVDEVKRELPDLLAEFPDDPGIQFLHGVVLEDASQALKIYERIIKEHPDCEWADDAQWRIVQFYALKNDTSRARKELKVYRDKYPQSEFLLNASEMVKGTVGFGKATDKNTSLSTETKAQTSTEIKPLTKPTESKPVSTSVASKPSTSVASKPIETKPIAKSTETKQPETKTTPKSIDSKTSAKPVQKKQIESKLVSKPETTKNETKPSKPTESKLTEAKQSGKPDPKQVETKQPAKPVETKTTAKSDSPTGTPNDPKGITKKDVWSLQVASYDTKETAETEVKQFKTKRLRASVIEKKVDDKTIYAVFIGEYTSKEAAEKAKIIVQQSCNCTPFVVVR